MRPRDLVSSDSIFPELANIPCLRLQGQYRRSRSKLAELGTTLGAGQNLGNWSALDQPTRTPLALKGTRDLGTSKTARRPGAPREGKRPGAEMPPKAMGYASRDSHHDIRIVGPMRFKICLAPLGSP